MSVVTSREVAVIITAAVANLFIAFYLYKWKSKIVISRTFNDGNYWNKKFLKIVENAWAWYSQQPQKKNFNV